jgi:hypothetical protein
VKFWLGLAIGVALGAGGAYLGLQRPWRDRASPLEDVVAMPLDAGVPASKKVRRKGGASRGSGSDGQSGANVTDEVSVLTAADRVLEWRGDVVALPPAQIELGREQSGRPLDDEEIQGVITGGSAPIMACISKAVGSAPLSAEVTAQMLVGGDGRVQKLRLRAPAYLHRKELLECGRRAAWGLRFPPTGAPTIVTAPFHLN